MKYFTIAEMSASATAVSRGIDNIPGPDTVSRLTRLVERVLDPLREAYGKPITVNSGYRCPALNRAVGGAAASQHLTGEAADITAGSRQENSRLYKLLAQLGLPVDQAINERGFSWIHVSHTAGHNRGQFLAL